MCLFSPCSLLAPKPPPTYYPSPLLQYVMGKYEAAAESLSRSLQTVREHFPQAG